MISNNIYTRLIYCYLYRLTIAKITTFSYNNTLDQNETILKWSDYWLCLRDHLKGDEELMNLALKGCKHTYMRTNLAWPLFSPGVSLEAAESLLIIVYLYTAN